MVAFLRHVKTTGDIPAEHYSHDHLNENKVVPIQDSLAERWATEFQRIHDVHAAKGVEVKYALVDGFLLYWHPEIVDLLDMCVFLRVPHDVLKQRRHKRHGYHTAGKRSTSYYLRTVLTHILFYSPPLLTLIISMIYKWSAI
jgi:nicotinamide/nicotinate riboside kinase